MASSNKKLIQKSVAIVVIVAILQLVGISPMIVLFATGIVFLVWMVNHRSQTRELEQIFNFYVAAEAILRDDERRWYGFEVVEVIDDGERAFNIMPDCPTLHLFALGALYHRIGKYELTAQYLERVLEDEHYDERWNTTPSDQLRRYVSMLRRLEMNPSIAPEKLAAVRSLERMRRRKAARLLQESRVLKTSATATVTSTSKTPANENLSNPTVHATPTPEYPVAETMSTRPPISEVLHDVYDVCEDDQSPLN
jgi:hypothetical protein